MDHQYQSPVHGEWDRHHRPRTRDNNKVPSSLYTDENPASTIKGLGFKDKKTAERTIYLTSQPGVRYKQNWTIRAMRERAAWHPHPSREMRDAMEVFDSWLKEEATRQLSPQEKKLQECEWENHRKLCKSVANIHAYGKDPTSEELKRSRNDIKFGKDRLLEGLRLAQSKRDTKMAEFEFPLTAFTALFGGPGLHGYGSHVIHNTNESSSSQVLIQGMESLEELLPNRAIPLGTEPKVVKVMHYHKRNRATVEIEYAKSLTTITMLWARARKKSTSSTTKSQTNKQIDTTGITTKSNKQEAWVCASCTFEHNGEAKQLYLICELCGTSRSSSSATVDDEQNVHNNNTNPQSCKMSSSLSKQFKNKHNDHPSCPLSSRITASWGGLKPPSKKDLQGPRKRPKALDKPPALLDYLVVLDLEWTAEKGKRMIPVAEITQLPSVVMKLVDNKKWGQTRTSNLEIMKNQKDTKNQIIPLPLDLTMHSCDNRALLQQDAFAISAFDTFVRPTINPKLTQFSVDLTAISQDQVDGAPTLDIAIERYMKWLESLHLVDEEGTRRGNWCFVTWGDVDIMTTLRQEVQFKKLTFPPCFDCWINLKSDSVFKRHYGRDPRGGLRSCVESVGATWEGRAHNGLIDSINTAKIVRHMVRTGYRFTRSTRGLDKSGIPFGNNNKRQKR